MTIVLINGPFGVGKSTAARLVDEHLSDAVLFDPETIGTYLGHILGHDALGHDYQDLPLWRHMVIDTAHRLREDWRPTLVVPMNLWHHDYFTEITDGFRRIDTNVVCFRLTCDPAVLRGRILARPDAEGGHDWCLSHLDSGLTAANDPRFGIGIDTTHLDPATIATRIITLAGL